MKYFALLVFLILIWMLMSEFVLADRKSEGLTSVWQKLKDLGSRFHLAVGVAAILILIYFVVRFVLAAIESQQHKPSQPRIDTSQVFVLPKNPQ